jgi:hypothetical protein
MSRNSQKDYHHDSLVVNDTTSDILTLLPAFLNCSCGILLGNDIYVHLCWYQRAVVVDIRKFNEKHPQLLGIGLKKENWYEVVQKMRNISNLGRDTDFNHTVLGYSDWLRV